MTTHDLATLLETVESVRQEIHPELPGSFLADVVKAEEENPDSDEAALRQIEAAMRQLLGSLEIGG